jgi:tRNA(Arg) A34 adenosine deaminase TadA
MFHQPSYINFALPEWLESYAKTYNPSFSLDERMKFVIGAARRNVEEESGRPFAAAVFEIGSGMLVSLGVNLVLTRQSSILHAEMVAIVIAHMKLGNIRSWQLRGMPAHELVSSAELCAMRFWAILW